jgi:hypothetical protein
MKHASQAAANVIYRLIEALHDLLTFGKSKNEEIERLKKKRDNLDSANEEYANIIEDRRENMKMNWRIAIMFLSIVIDFALCYSAMIILCGLFNWPTILKFIVPAILIIAEIIVSYFQILHQRTGERAGWLARNAQYFVIMILVALSILVIAFTAQSYNPSLDGNFFSFIIGTVLVQLVLLLSSISLHVWLIRHSEALAEAFAYLGFKNDRKQLTKRIEKLEKENKNKHTPRFVQDAQRLVQKVELFKRQFPGVPADFERVMSMDLIEAINRVMGRQVFQTYNAEAV